MSGGKDRPQGSGWAHDIVRRIAALWARLLGALRGRTPGLTQEKVSGALPAAPAAPEAVPEVPSAARSDVSEILPRVETIDSVPETLSLRTVPPAPVSAPARPAVASAPARPAVAEEPKFALEVEEAPAKPTRKRAAPAVETTWTPDLGMMRVRQFFGRIVMAAPGAAEVDLGDWQRVSVERFFLAIGSPRVLARREPPTSGGEAMSIGNAFEGFEWD